MTKLLIPLVLISGAALAPAAIINVVETGGDNEATDTITAKWTGVTYNATVNNEPVPGISAGSPYTVTTFQNLAPAFVDRNHRYFDDSAGTGVGLPGYLVGQPYIMSGNDNRDNANYLLDVTIDSPARVFMLIDNRLQDGNGADPPSFGPSNMQWILDEGWLAASTGNNRAGDPGLPDEIAFDEGADDDVDQWYSIYYRDFGAGTFQLRQADNAGRNMYGAVVGVIPEPSSLCLLGLSALALLRRRR